MSTPDLERFRRLCRDFRRLTVFMVASVGLLLAFMHLVAPALLWMRDGGEGRPFPLNGRLITLIPTLLYLWAVWAIGAAVGRLGEGRLIQPTLAKVLREVGLALVAGGVASVFVVTNVLRMLGETKGGLFHFDVPGMTLGMIGGALFLLGRVVDQAGAVQSELEAARSELDAARSELEEMV